MAAKRNCLPLPHIAGMASDPAQPLDKRARIPAFKEQKVDLKVDADVDRAGADQQIAAIRTAALRPAGQAGILAYGQPVAGKFTLQPLHQPFGLRDAVDDHRPFGLGRMLQKKGEQPIVQMLVHPGFDAVRANLQLHLVQNLTPAGRVGRRRPMTVAPVDHLHRKACPLQRLLQQRTGGSRLKEKLAALAARHFVDQQQRVDDADNLRRVKDVKFVEGKLLKRLHQRAQKPVRRIPRLAGPHIKQVHHIVKNVRVGQHHVVVVEQCLQRLPALCKIAPCHSAVQHVAVQRSHHRCLAPQRPGLLGLAQLVPNQLIGRVHGEQLVAPALHQRRQLPGQALAVAGHRCVEDHLRPARAGERPVGGQLVAGEAPRRTARTARQPLCQPALGDRRRVGQLGIDCFQLNLQHGCASPV